MYKKHLGSLLFLIWFNYIALACTISSPIMIANDTNMILCKTNTTNEVVMSVARWFQLNKPSLNIKKSNFVIYMGRGRSYDRNYAGVSIEGNSNS